MSEDKRATPEPRSAPPGEKRGVVTGVFVPLAQTAVDAAGTASVAAWVGHEVSKPKPPPRYE